ncbi:hypothetical protein D3C76_1404090 [compost metagenome]
MALLPANELRTLLRVWLLGFAGVLSKSISPLPMKSAPLLTHPVLKVVGDALSGSPSASVSLASSNSAGTATLPESTLVMTWSSAATGATFGMTLTTRLELARSPSLSLMVKPMFSVSTTEVVFCEM